MTAALAALLAAAAVVLAGGRIRRRPVPANPSVRRSQGRRRRAVVTLAAAVLVGTAAIVGAATAAALAALALLGRIARRRRERRRLQRERDAAFPDLVDLFRIAAAAGNPVHRCVEVVAARAPAPARPPLAAILARTRRGVPLAEALDAAGADLGSSGPVLADALRAALRTGAPLGPVLDQVVAVARDRRTRSAQAAARRLPVSMLFPLVCCVLPAFGLLAVAPLLAGSLGSLAP
ncbi:MAG: type II secretion system F family protein [Acidimicrobiales bacterium]